MICKATYGLVLSLTFVLFLSGCNPDIIKSIKNEYKYLYNEYDEYNEYGFGKYHFDCINATRESILEDFFDKNHINNDRLFLIEITNEQYKDMYAFIYAKNTNLERYYHRKSRTPCDSINKSTPSESFDIDFYRFVIKKANEGKFDELKQGSVKYPMSNSGTVYLTIIDYRNKKDFKIIKSLEFAEYREY